MLDSIDPIDMIVALLQLSIAVGFLDGMDRLGDPQRCPERSRMYPAGTWLGRFKWRHSCDTFRTSPGRPSDVLSEKTSASGRLPDVFRTVILTSFSSHFGVILVSFWRHFGVILASFGGHLGVIWASFGRHLGVIWASFCGVV